MGAEGRLAHRLFHDLFTNYTSALRPVADTDQALNVTLEVTLSQIIDMVRCSGWTTVECTGDSVKELGGEKLGLFSKQFFSVNVNNSSYYLLDTNCWLPMVCPTLCTLEFLPSRD